MNYSSIAALSIAIAVLLGAFGSHGLEDKLDAQSLKTWQTAVLYHLTMSVALFAFSCKKKPYNLPKALLFIGMVAFSGSLYLYVLSNFRPLVFFTPIGGVLMVIGWLTDAWQLRQEK